MLNNPIRYNDPTGHMCSDPDDPTPSCDGSGTPPPTTPLPNPGGGGNGGEGGGDDDDDDGNNNDDVDLADELAQIYGGGKPLYSLIPYYDTATFIKLPPSPVACGWYDCALSLASVIFSVGTFPGMPKEIQGPAYVLDIVVTVLAIESTEDAYRRGEITEVHRKALNGTGIVGAFPSPIGLGLSLGNLWFTLSGYPR